MNCTHRVKTAVTSRDNWVSSRNKLLSSHDNCQMGYTLFTTLWVRKWLWSRVYCHTHWFACTIHRRNCVHGLPKLLVVYWLELSIVVRVRVRARNREWISDCFFFFVLNWQTPLSCWFDSYLGGARANQWAWYRKHMTIVTFVLGVLWTKHPFVKSRYVLLHHMHFLIFT